MRRQSRDCKPGGWSYRAVVRTDPQIEIYRRLTPRQRPTAAPRLWRMARSLAARGVRSRQPGLSESDVARRVAAQFRDAAR